MTEANAGMKTYIVLGGGGSFGVHTAMYLLAHANPKKVISVGRNPEKPEPFSLNVGKGDPRYAYHQIHIGHEPDRLFELFDAEKPEVIISYAAQGEGAVSWKKSWRFFDTNCVALVKMAEELMQRKYLERFIQIGTSELYGSVDFAAKEETPLQPTSPYAASKAAFDMYLLSVSKVLKFPMNIIRPSNAYCPGQLLHRVVPKAVVCGLTGRKLPLQGGGRARKSYIHARDLARAILLVSEKAPLGKVYNAGPTEPIAIRDLVAKVAEGFKMPFEQLCEITGDRLGQDGQYWLDSSAIKRDVGWEPQISLKEGIQEMITWGREYLDFLEDYPTDYILRA
jgi:dTDP-glucose 4,6-dehydratase